MSVTPDFIGQIYKDTNTGNLWRANSLTPGDWTLELQNMQAKWTPHPAKLGQVIGFVSNYSNVTGLDGITALVFEQATINQPIDLGVGASILSVSFPNLVSFTDGAYLSITGSSAALTTISAPILQSVDNDLTIDVDSATSVSFPSLQTVNGRLNIHNILATSLDLSSLVSSPSGFSLLGNSALDLVDVSSFLPTPGKNVVASNCALNTSTVDLFLARCVAVAAWGNSGEELHLEGGTNSAPTSTGVGSDYATLVARGASVSVNP